MSLGKYKEKEYKEMKVGSATIHIKAHGMGYFDECYIDIECEGKKAAVNVVSLLPECLDPEIMKQIIAAYKKSGKAITIDKY